MWIIINYYHTLWKTEYEKTGVLKKIKFERSDDPDKLIAACNYLLFDYD